MTAADAAHGYRGARLTLVRLLAALIILVSVGLFVFGMVSFNSALRTPCAAWNPVDQAWCAERRQSLQQLGLSTNSFVTFLMVGIFIEMVPWIILSLLIFWRKSSEPYEILFSVALILFGTVAIDEGFVKSAVYFHPGLQWLANGLRFLASVCLSMWFVFPDGRFVPRWTRWVAVFWTVRCLMWLLLPGSPFDLQSGPAPIPQLVATAFVAVLVCALLYRYRRAADQTQRQQIKWVAFGALAFGLVVVTSFSLDTGPTPAGTLTNLVMSALVYAMSFVLALCLGVSILRYRLWDIDLILSRTLVYLPLTALTAGIFAASIALIQRLFLARTGATSDVAIGIATLVTVALIDPIKTAMQKTVDVRFKEGRDPAAKLKAFGDAVQNELGVLDSHRVARRLLDESVSALNACSGAVYLGSDGSERLIHAHGAWNGDAHLTVRLEIGALRLGRLELGERKNGAEYARRDRENLEKLAATVAQALSSDGAERGG